MEEIIRDADNKSQRVQQLLQKANMVETLEDATGMSFKELVKQRRTAGENRVGDSDSGGTRTHRGGCLSGQWPEFIYSNPWTAQDHTEMLS